MTHARFAFAAALSVLALSSQAHADETVRTIVIDDPTIHVDAASNVILQRVEPNGNVTPLCKAPCDKPVDSAHQYQLTGEGLRASNRFRLPPSGDATVSVKPRSSGGFVAGIVLLTVSGVMATGGFLLLGATVALGNNGDLNEIWTGLGAINCGIASLATGIPGILLLTNNIQSRAKVLEGDERATATRAPTLPAAHTAPLVSVSF